MVTYLLIPKGRAFWIHLTAGGDPAPKVSETD